MEMKELLAGHPTCTCGKTHLCPIKHVVIRENACDSLTTLTASYHHVLLAADSNTYAACGVAAAEKIGIDKTDLLIFQRDGILVPDEAAIAELKAHITKETDLIIGVGSGVINDLCKHVSFLMGLPYYIVATAPSMDGYASKGAALILDGMKVTLNADVPKAIIADVHVLQNAPLDMIQAGYGDIIGKYSCLNDWKLSHLVNGEYLCDFVMDATYEAVEKTVKLAEGLREQRADAVCALMEALVSVGILMAYVGNSRPASGSEHHMAHYFEITGIINKTSYFPHGVDVCYSAIETARLREELLKIDTIPSSPIPFDHTAYEADIRRIYTTIADEVLTLQKKLNFYTVDRISIYRDKWPQIRAILADAPSAAEMQEMTEKIGLSYQTYKDFYGKQKIQDALYYAKDLKDRYTVLWMYYDLLHKQYPSPQIS